MLDRTKSEENISVVLAMVTEDFSKWSVPVIVTQHQINAFANATDDRQWIHTDTERARAGPFRSTIAQGLLTIGLIASTERAYFAMINENVSGGRILHVSGAYKLRSHVCEGEMVCSRGKIASAQKRGLRSALLRFEYEIAVAPHLKLAATGHMELLCIL